MKLLLVEDDLDLGAALQRSLEQADLSSVWVRRLGDGHAAADSGQFDCVLLDINLPDGEGFVFLERVRQGKNQVPFIVMTARDALDDRLRALNGGADDYIIKPFLLPELIARIHVAVRRAAGQACRKWQFGSLEIDLQQGCAKLGELPLDLTPKEFAILFELARQSGRVLRRELLIQKVWPGEEEPSAGALEFQPKTRGGHDPHRARRGLPHGDK